MRNETIAIHAGYDPDPTTKAVAVPIYQTASYAFDSADHGAALFNLETEGFRYSRIANPTTSVLEKRIAELEGGVGALAVASGQAALHFSLINVADGGGNIVSVPQLYGTTHTLLSHILPRQGITGRFAESDQPDAIERLIDDDTKAVFAESIGNPAGNVCDIEALAKVAHRHGVPLIVDEHPIHQLEHRTEAFLLIKLESFLLHISLSIIVNGSFLNKPLQQLRFLIVDHLKEP